MAKRTKKKNRKLRRQVRKTVGALLMISAITVAAIPVPDVNADVKDPVKRVAVVNYSDKTMRTYDKVHDSVDAPAAWQSKVPFVDPNATIYTTGSGQETGATFQFAYVPGEFGATGDEVAVILGANVTNLDKGNLTIPEKVDAYKKYTANQSSSGYCAVNRNDQFLYYKTQVQAKDENEDLLYRVPLLTGDDGKELIVTQWEVTRVSAEGGTTWRYQKQTGTDAEGKPIFEYYSAVPKMTEGFAPCYYETRSEWKDITTDDQMYYYDSTKATTTRRTRIRANSVMSVGTPTPTIGMEEATPTPTIGMEEATPTPTIGMEEATPTPTIGMEEATPTPTIGMEEATPTPAIGMEEAAPTPAVGMEEATPASMPMDESNSSVITMLHEAEESAGEKAAPKATPTATPTATPDGTDAAELEKTEVEGNAKSAMAENRVMEQNVIKRVTLLNSSGGDAPDTSVDLEKTECFVRATEQKDQWIHNADVRYIGRQRLTGENGEWKIDTSTTIDPKGNGVITNPDLGVFAGKGQIVNLKIDDNLLGIGDFAFYGCTGIQEVTLGNGLNTIGNGAFANCINMKNCYLQLYSQIAAIGKDAFANCQQLKDIVIPVNVQAIGDYCFQGCSSLESIELCGKGEKVALSVIGYNAFVNCSRLASVTFPETFVQTNNPNDTDAVKMNKMVPVSYFAGCTALQYIKIQNATLDIIDGTDDKETGTEEGDHEGENAGSKECDIDKYLGSVFPDTFYFEGPESSSIHDTAKAHEAAFKYLNEDKYEKVVRCSEVGVKDDVPTELLHPNTFIVNSKFQLIDMQIADGCGEVEIPAKIGTYGVSILSGTSFQNNCNLRKIIIPATVNTIEAGAFKGCHNLKDVIFLQPENAGLVIANGAFDTQDVAYHKDNCPNTTIEKTPSLSFTGTISPDAAPFKYAMDPENNINVGQQTVNTYITFYSGWPTNLTVKYNADTQKNELLDYPRYDELKNYTKDSYPYMTSEYVAAAQKAVEYYESDNITGDYTQDMQDIVNSALNVNLPAGIESIAPGIFSGIDSDGKQIEETIEKPDPADPDKTITEKVPVTPNKKIATITMNTVDTVEPYTFAGCSKLKGFYMAGGNMVDDYALKNCESLENVNIAPSVTELGIRPFAGCGKLLEVNFDDSPNFVCEDMIIYGKTNGANTKIVECLEARGDTHGNTQVGPEELVGITTIQAEAFKNCDGIGSVDLTSSSVTEIPDQCFAQTDRIYSVLLPETANSINTGAFWNSKIAYAKIPASVTYIEPQAFANVEEDTNGEIKFDGKGEPTIENGTEGHSTVTVYCTENTAADTYAGRYYYINPTYFEPEIYHTVYFWDNYVNKNEPSLLDTQKVLNGTDAVPPTEVPVHEGVTFTGWTNYKNIVRDTDVYAEYGSQVHTVRFIDTIGGTELSVQLVADGKSAEPPEAPVHEGFTFTGWAPDYHDVTADVTILAQYTDNSGDGSRHTVTFYSFDGTTVISTQKVNHDEAATAPMPPAREGWTFAGWVPNTYTKVTSDMNIIATYTQSTPPGGSPSPSSSSSPGADGKASPSPSPSATPSASPEVKKYTVSVSGGSGSGSYAAGEIVVVNAYYMGDGQLFDKWTSSTAGVGFANPNATSTTFTMPAANVAVTATYKTGSVGSAAAGTGSSGGSGGSTAGTGNTNNGTTVEITKPGISNTNLAGATVSGATDNFIVKVTEDQAATDAVVAALQARYGDISRIKYLPMDISLYDSTGRVKIADTTGITVNLTLPLPDDLIQYAGNNKVAAISNGALEDLNARFTTVDGVPCVNFTATHFSPYVIYVDTANLTEATIDVTPKTGDPIHPKWFLALGMACVSLILFFKRDKVIINTRIA